jgi:hypothetical protein
MRGDVSHINGDLELRFRNNYDRLLIRIGRLLI